MRSVINGSFRTYFLQQLMDVHNDCRLEFPKGKLCCVIQAIIDEVQIKMRLDEANLVCGSWKCTTSEDKKYQIFMENNNIYVDEIDKSYLHELKKYLNEPFPETKCEDIKDVLCRCLPKNL